MKKFDIVIILLFPLLVGLFLISVISVYSNYYFLDKNIANNSSKYFTSVTATLNHLIKNDTNLMEGLLDKLQHDQNIISLFNENKVEDLYQYLYPIYKKQLNNYGLTHFYIHLPNKRNYLRVHNRNETADVIERTTLNNAVEKLQVSSGIEFGVSHNLTLRVVSPWIIDGKLLGFLELGKEIDLITKEYAELIQSDIIYTVKKELIPQVDFEKWKTKNYRNRNYFLMDNFYIIDSTLETIEELQKILNKKFPILNEYVENNNKKYFVNSKKQFDINGKNVGYVFILNDVTQEYDFLYSLVTKVTLIIFILLILMLTYYTLHIKSTESILNKRYKEIQDLSMRDGMTMLYNKLYYQSHIPKLIQKCSRFEMAISFILLDVDNFKKYNDNYGHLKGDEVLKQVAKVIHESFKRDDDFCFRVGGEEFLIVTASRDNDNSIAMANQLLKDIQDLQIEHKYNENYKIVTASIGITRRVINYSTNIDELYHEADQALYTAKNNGRNRIEIYEKRA